MLAHLLLTEFHCTGLPRQWLVPSIRIKQKREALGPASLSGIARPWVLCSVGLNCSQYCTPLADGLFMNLIDFFSCVSSAFNVLKSLSILSSGKLLILQDSAAVSPPPGSSP